MIDREAVEEARGVAAPLCNGSLGKVPDDLIKWKVCGP